ncbi:sporulation protein YjcZ [Paenibacillus alvei]|uniref:Sporulation protein YjcZ n=1 Tax=Paenibacillus alvei TaxID=44250 RepID=A0AAP7A0C1_PAEAL|nr:sporulation protein YjcZ [Paenibacillus alvei]NOJ71472.1 sporulation protein YjcZ [Paenibacillus alvei]
MGNYVEPYGGPGLRFSSCFWTATTVILALFILLVIILRAPLL